MKHSASLLVFFLLFIASCTNRSTSKSDFNIVLITIDTLRADHLSCYGYHRNTSPNIDKIARKGILFTNTVATSSFTSPSMASIMTSLYPVNHGIRHGIIKSGEVYDQEILNGKFDTLVEILKGNGYTTFGAVANIHMAKELGFGQGFDYYYCEGFDEASALNEVIFSWRDQLKNSKKYFLWVHYFDPHHFYNPRTPWISDYSAETWIGKNSFEKMSMNELKKLIPVLEDEKNVLDYLIALYDSEISYVDYHMGNLFLDLGLDQHSMIIITSDHGEEFLDHGSLGHAHTLYQELIHVPLIIKPPVSLKESLMSINHKHASIIDIMPTILGSLEIIPPHENKGNNLFEVKMSSTEQTRDYIFSELDCGNIVHAILKNNWKYIYNAWTQGEELYNLSKDNKESDNLIHKNNSTATELKKELFNYLSKTPQTSPTKKRIKPTKEIEEKLKAMGYIEDDK